jgi:hypothetical protein
MTPPPPPDDIIATKERLWIVSVLRVHLCDHIKLLCNKGSHSWTHCLVQVTMTGDVTIETEVCSLL